MSYSPQSNIIQELQLGPDIPSSIKVVRMNTELPVIDDLIQDKNNSFGLFLNHLNINYDTLEYCRYDSGKPYLKLDDRIISVSVTHSKSIYLMAINLGEGDVGIDVELITRSVHPGLSERIRCVDDQFDDDLSDLQKWTIKEAILKMTGTGLRTGMNKVMVRSVSPGKFKSFHDNYEISIVSLDIDGYYIAVAWTTNHK